MVALTGLLVAFACWQTISPFLGFEKSAYARIGWAIVLGLLMSNKSRREAYDLDHAMLNVKRPSTMWLNMGYWKNTNDFPSACEALARKLADFVLIRPGDRLLDLGFGCGESIMLWAQNYNPSSIVGVTSLKGHRELAQATLRDAEGISMDAQIDLQVGDAVQWTVQAVKSDEPPQFDKILALDCAYHFQTRHIFLKNAFRLLDPIGGTIGLTDLMLPVVPLSITSRCVLRFICLVSRVPFSNLITQAEYTAQLREIGYQEIQIDDITADVFTGLADYIDATAKDRLFQAINGGMPQQYKMFSYVLRWWAKGNLSFVLVRAKRGLDKPSRVSRRF